ncbi:MAG: hypothetical protein KF758_04750 [Anaerolineales bacterium]|nr:hypothetical protein [Anaerolineales bacterium]
MVTVQFKTKIKNGVITIPKKYQNKLSESVRVILRVENKKKSSINYLDLLMANPIKVENFNFLTREQIYS